MTAPLRRQYASRAVHLLITPRPSSLGESREILRLLSNFGEIEHYQNLKYDNVPAPQAALVIYKEESAAVESLRRSPIRFRMGKVSGKQPTSSSLDQTEGPIVPAPAIAVTDRSQNPFAPSGSFAPFGVSTPQSRSISTQHSPIPRPPQGPTPNPPMYTPMSPESPEESSRIFQVLTSPSRRAFRDKVEAGRFYGSFAIDSKLAGQEDLSQRVPRLGLSCIDWRAEERAWRIVHKDKDRINAQKSLGALYEEALAAGGTRQDTSSHQDEGSHQDEDSRIDDHSVVPSSYKPF